MSSLTRTMLPAVALAAMMSVAHAQTKPGLDHDAHHPDAGAAAARAAPSLNADAIGPMGAGGMPMMGHPGLSADGTPAGMGSAGAMMPMMHRMMMGQPRGGMGTTPDGMGMPFEHVEGRIAFLKAELGITEAQRPQWSAFADALRTTARTHRTMHERMMSGDTPASWPDRIALRREVMKALLDTLSSLEAAATPLYDVLRAEQKDMADRLLSGPMGVM